MPSRRILRRNELATQTWDYENRVAVIETASELHTMAYDADGLRRQDVPCVAQCRLRQKARLTAQVAAPVETGWEAA